MFVKEKRRCYKKGTSLVELMIFVLIIAILGSVTYRHMLGMFGRAHDASVKSNMFTLKVAAENFSTMAHGMYPIDPTYSVQNVLSDMGITSSNQMRLADNCPATCFDVNTGLGYALLPGENTYINPILFNGNCLDATGAGGVIPPWAVIAPYSSGQGTVFWNPDFALGTFSTSGYNIFGEGYDAWLLDLILQSGE